MSVTSSMSKAEECRRNYLRVDQEEFHELEGTSVSSLIMSAACPLHKCASLGNALDPLGITALSPDLCF